MAAAAAWVPDEAVTACSLCAAPFTAIMRRRHHCRRCGRVVCAPCSPHELPAPGAPGDAGRTSRHCVACYVDAVCARRGLDLAEVRGLVRGCVTRSGDEAEAGQLRARIAELEGEVAATKDEIDAAERDNAELGAALAAGKAVQDMSRLAAFAARMNDLAYRLAVATDELLELRSSRDVVVRVVRAPQQLGPPLPRLPAGPGEVASELGPLCGRSQVLVVTRGGLVALSAMPDCNAEALRASGGGDEALDEPRLVLVRHVDELARADQVATLRVAGGDGVEAVLEHGVELCWETPGPVATTASAGDAAAAEPAA